jgi:hypothetical protein
MIGSVEVAKSTLNVSISGGGLGPGKLPVQALEELEIFEMVSLDGGQEGTSR